MLHRRAYINSRASFCHECTGDMMMRMHVHRNFTAGNFVNLSLQCYVAKFSDATNETKIHTATLRSVICKRTQQPLRELSPVYFTRHHLTHFGFYLYTSSDMRLQLSLVNK